MNETSNLMRVVTTLAVLVGSMVLTQAAQGKAVVRQTKGVAEVSEGGSWKALKAGQELSPGAVLRTANDSSVDLFLDQNGPLVRLMENTTLGIEKLTFESTGVDTVIETQLDLKTGQLVGIVKKLSGVSKYEIKTPNGVAGIRGTEYVIGADGTVYVLSGQVVVVYVKPDGSVVTQVVNEGEMFNPATQKVEPIPEDRLADLKAEAASLRGGAAAPERIEPPPVILVSPISGTDL
jgi:hypothetical protein